MGTRGEADAAWAFVEHRLAVLGISLPAGAKDDEIALAERSLEVEFPDSVRLVFRVHDGTGDVPRGLLSLGQVVELWAAICEDTPPSGEYVAHGPCKAQPWNRRWVPVRIDEDEGCVHCVDLDPPADGVLGQVLAISDPDREVTVVSSSLVAALPDFIRFEDLPPNKKQQKRLKPSEAAWHTWRGIEAEIVLYATASQHPLPSGADERQIADAERAFGRSMPEVVRELYRLHDGFGVPLIRGGVAQPAPFLSLGEAVEEWRGMQRVLHAAPRDAAKYRAYGPVRAVRWMAGWIPIAADGAGNYRCLDLEPKRGGTPGQVIEYWHDDYERRVAAASLPEYLLFTAPIRDWLLLKEQ